MPWYIKYFLSYIDGDHMWAKWGGENECPQSFRDVTWFPGGSCLCIGTRIKLPQYLFTTRNICLYLEKHTNIYVLHRRMHKPKKNPYIGTYKIYQRKIHASEHICIMLQIGIGQGFSWWCHFGPKDINFKVSKQCLLNFDLRCIFSIKHGYFFTSKYRFEGRRGIH